ncbi:GntR family transcriptional regulator [Clostridium cylindrosporum]|uniref:GntR family transcriptional regulator n=1 Tax=Clostridium cylindrosporum DSM 605 TaxID=1121307 RepID=A0A0J8D4J2_CLOCY|nr:GntR family transcriptional regulator [Clostridium cylindrosporum]KMT21085.1 GntR family transcriptional regulator [Clostridium cylindrosporum DSM 605]
MDNKKIKRINKISAVQKGLESLREYIKTTDNLLLPSEDYLSQSLGVSRLTVREAVTVLEREGIVSRIQGKGTLINSFIKKLENRIDLGSDIEGCLRENGLEVEFKVVSIESRLATTSEILKLELEEGDSILEIKKILLGNNEAEAIYIDRIPEKHLKSTNFTIEDFKPSIFPVVESLCECTITHDVVHIYPYSADKEISEIFNIPEKTPIQSYEVLEYTSDGLPIMYITEYYSGKFIRFTLCRNVNYKA